MSKIKNEGLTRVKGLTCRRTNKLYWRHNLHL